MIKLWKVDQKQSTVRLVEGEPWPGCDSEGDICYNNTHFIEERLAWNNLCENAEAYVGLSGASVARAEQQLREAQQGAGEACKQFDLAIRNSRKARQVGGW